MLLDSDNFMISYSENKVYVHKRNHEDPTKIMTLELDKHEATALFESLKDNLTNLIP